jgi:hypothetical protein
MEYYYTQDYPSLRVSETYAQQLLQKLSKQYKYSEKLLKQYVRNNVYYEVHLQDGKPSAYKVFQKTIEKVTQQNSKLVEITFTKEKLPVHAFPSSNDLHSIAYIRRIVFRKNSHIFANIDTVLEGDEVYYMCYVNVNVDSNSDIAFLQQEAKPLVTVLQHVQVSTS